MKVAALVGELMDRSRIEAAIPGVLFGGTLEDAQDADVVVVDLGRYGALIPALRQAFPDARLVCFGPHADEESAEGARRDGADVVMTRSRFFRDPAAAVSSEA